MPGAPFQSKLLPHLTFIRECRAQRLSYPRIAAELRMRFSVNVAASTVFSFVKVRSRRRHVVTLPGPEPAPTAALCCSPPGSRTSVRDSWLTYDPSQPLEKDPP